MRRVAVGALVLCGGCFVFINTDHYDTSLAPSALDGGDAGDVAATSPIVDAGTDARADADASIDTIDEGDPRIREWTSPNGASWERTDAGIRIVSVGANHAVLVPDPPLAISSDVYTLRAEIIAGPSLTEFGVVVRLQKGGAGVFASEIGVTNTPYLGVLDDKDWNIDGTTVVAGAQYEFMPYGRYHLAVQVGEGNASAKMWLDGDPEPAKFAIAATIPFGASRVVGFYVYAGGSPDALTPTLARFEVTSMP